MPQFLKCGVQVGHLSTPAVQPPDQHCVDLPAPRSLQQLLPQLAIIVQSQRK
jgi:hypothetical protein